MIRSDHNTVVIMKNISQTYLKRSFQYHLEVLKKQLLFHVIYTNEFQIHFFLIPTH